MSFFGDLANTISGKTKQDLTADQVKKEYELAKAQIEAAAAAKAAALSPDVLKAKSKSQDIMIIGAVIIGALLIWKLV